MLVGSPLPNRCAAPLSAPPTSSPVHRERRPMLGANIGFADILSTSTNDGAPRLRRIPVSPPLRVGRGEHLGKRADVCHTYPPGSQCPKSQNATPNRERPGLGLPVYLPTSRSMIGANRSMSSPPT